MRKTKSKMLVGAATLGALVGVAMMAEKIHENNRSSLEKLIDQLTDHLK